MMNTSSIKARPRTGMKSKKQPRMVSYAEFKEIERIKEQAHIGPGAHDPHKKFGAELKKITIGGKYKWKPDGNPPPGLYDVESSMNMTKPKLTYSRRLDHDQSKRSDFTKQPMQENPSAGNYKPKMTK